ncbi:MAG: MerR family DNA-binding transcriptional regulator [Candidatus Doudnabacteria bacterium]|nr:MerR family DNA-binding transcriptional regulator [Candidatus Doudnabacteria bacterium]
MREKLHELLTLRQVTQLLSVHPNTLRNWEKEGLIESIRLGPRGDRRYKREIINKILNQTKHAE